MTLTKNEQRIWDAAKNGTGKYPAGTTVADLTKYTTDTGWSALHSAAHYGQLPVGTTVADLTQYADDNGETPWESMRWGFLENPHFALRTPPELFKDHHTLAIGWVNDMTTKNVALTAKATLWLSRVFAASTSK